MFSVLRQCKEIFKEICYSRIPVEISLHVSIFPGLAVLEIHFMVFRSSYKIISRPGKGDFLNFPSLDKLSKKAPQIFERLCIKKF